mmetsp:Transcript_15879/g.32540  ORF Transcript_15879/g.32540 Transcript_15879/m.32540 type:complete len:307 (+) Transcript_15879:457-1377(+)
MSSSASEALPTSENQSGWTTMWQVEQAMIPLQAHSIISPRTSAPSPSPNLAMSVRDMSSNPSTRKARFVSSFSSSPSPSPDAQAFGGKTQKPTVVFPVDRASSTLTLSTRDSRPASSSTSHRPARDRTIANRAGPPETPDCFNASRTPLATSSSWPRVATRKAMALDSGSLDGSLLVPEMLDRAIMVRRCCCCCCCCSCSCCCCGRCGELDAATTTERTVLLLLAGPENGRLVENHRLAFSGNDDNERHRPSASSSRDRICRCCCCCCCPRKKSALLLLLLLLFPAIRPAIVPKQQRPWVVLVAAC